MAKAIDTSMGASMTVRQSGHAVTFQEIDRLPQLGGLLNEARSAVAEARFVAPSDSMQLKALDIRFSEAAKSFQHLRSTYPEASAWLQANIDEPIESLPWMRVGPGVQQVRPEDHAHFGNVLDAMRSTYELDAMAQAVQRRIADAT